MKSLEANKAHFAQKCMKICRQFIPTVMLVRTVGINRSLYDASSMEDL